LNILFALLLTAEDAESASTDQTFLFKRFVTEKLFAISVWNGEHMSVNTT
jgi:hypothetical protein